MGAFDILLSILPRWTSEVQKPSSIAGGAACPYSTDSDEKAIIACPVSHGSGVTSIKDQKFHNAAAKQVPGIRANVDPRIIDENDLGGNLDQNLLIASPYNDEEHRLDLETLSRPNSLLARVLTIMNATTSEYAIEPYHEAFNWDEVVEALRKLSEREDCKFPRSEFYIIVFRSKLPFDADRVHLGKLDKDAHLEAVESGQLLKYWFGTPHPETGRNLATCIWRHRDDAKKGGAGPGHVRAMEAVRGIYLEWRVERLKLVIEDDATAWSIGKWID